MMNAPFQYGTLATKENFVGGGEEDICFGESQHYQQEQEGVKGKGHYRGEKERTGVCRSRLSSLVLTRLLR